MKKRSSFLLATGALIAICLASPAQAAMKLRFDSGSGPVTVTDNAAGDNCSAAGLICYTDVSGGGLQISVNTGTSKPIIGPGLLALNSVSISLLSAANFQIAITDTGFLPPAPTGNVQMYLAAGGTVSGGDSISVTGYSAGPNGVEFGNTYATSTLNFSNPGTLVNSYSDTAFSSLFDLAAPYSMTTVMNISFGAGGGNVQFSSELGFVPEPTSLVLLGGVLLFSARALRRRAKHV